jgi:hypothetical protein
MGMRARGATGVILLLAVAGMVAGAQAADTYTPPSIDAFLGSIRAYPFAAGAARREKIRLGVPQLTRCMASAEVRKLIGDPDFGYVGYKSGTNGRVPAKLIWNYVLEKKARAETEPGSRVVVWFDTNSKIEAVTVHGAPDIEATVSRRPQTCT